MGLPWEKPAIPKSDIWLSALAVHTNTLSRIVFPFKTEVFKNTTLLETARHVKKHNSPAYYGTYVFRNSTQLHESFIRPVWICQEKKFQCFLHIFTDGKDSFHYEAKTLIFNLKERMEKLNLGKIATVMGRQFAMDRGNNWHFTEIAYRSLAVKNRNNQRYN